MKTFRKYFPFAKGGFLEVLTYRFNIISWLVADIFIFILNFYLWSAIFKNSASEVINGFTFLEMIHYLIIAQITLVFTSASGSFWMVMSDIQSGDIAMTLIKPINYHLRLLFTSLGSLLGIFLVIILPFLIGVYLWLHFYLGVAFPSLLSFIFYLISAFFSLMILDAFNYIFGLIAFYTYASFGLMQIKFAITNFLSGVYLPLIFFPEIFQKIFAFLPFASMNTTPNLIMLGKITDLELYKQLGLQIFWAILLYFLGDLMYRKAIKKVVIQGG